VPFPDRELLHQLGWHDKLAEVDIAIASNAKFLRALVAQTQIFGEQGEEVENPEYVNGGDSSAEAREEGLRDISDG